MCTCLACPNTFPRLLTIQEETRRCHSYLIRMISGTSSDSDSSCNRVLNAIGSVSGLMSFTSSSLNKDAPLAFRRLPDSSVGSSPSFLDQKLFRHRTSGIPRLGQTQHHQYVHPVNTSIGNSAFFFDASCFFTCARASQSKLW